ncbi:F-box domain [Dillenia turbinata]|uniref:F-box domain n=1 Tax=Dillenia turbinata TaxID=194707 RepID=A0AAN8W3R8_9MAGN
MSLSVDEVAGNSDLLTQILIRLPTKSLYRFKSVSKQWLSLISSHRFSLHHFTQNTSFGLLLIAPDYKIKYKLLSLQPQLQDSSKVNPPPPYFPLELDNELSGTQIIQSCNGLFLCSSIDITYDIPLCKYYVCDPVTKKHKSLKPPPNSWVSENEEVGFWLVLAFDPLKSVHKYRVVCVRVHNSDSMGMVHSISVYDSEMGNWRLVSDDPFQVPETVRFYKGVYWNGAILWPNINKFDVSSYDIYDFLCFDIDQERFRTIPMPSVDRKIEFAECEYFGESCGHLHLVYKDKSGEFYVVEMEKDYSKLVIKSHFSVRDILGEAPPGPVLVLNLVSGVDEEESYVLLSESGRIFSCKFKNKSLKEVCETPAAAISKVLFQHSWCSNIYYHQYIETLFCV